MKALETGAFAGAPVDLKDGYIHLSTADQLAETIDKHFVGQHDLWLAAVDLEAQDDRSEEHTSELQSLMRISYAVFRLKKEYHSAIETNIHTHIQLVQ